MNIPYLDQKWRELYVIASKYIGGKPFYNAKEGVFEFEGNKVTMEFVETEWKYPTTRVEPK